MGGNKKPVKEPTGESNNNNNKQDTGNKAYKFLLLGSGESGKSTFHKQLKILFENANFKDEIVQFTNVVYANIVVTIQSLGMALKKKQYTF